jgi:hypothetical protein
LVGVELGDTLEIGEADAESPALLGIVCAINGRQEARGTMLAIAIKRVFEFIRF